MCSPPIKKVVINGTVEFINGGFWIIWKDNLHFPSDREIIGNIHNEKPKGVLNE